MRHVTGTGNTLVKSQILGGIRASVPRSTIITQGRQAITESRGRYRVHNFSKPVTQTQKHHNRRISAQNVKNMLKFTPITLSLPGNAVLRHNCTQKFHLARNRRIPNAFRTSNLLVSIYVICSRGITTSGTRSFPKSWLIRKGSGTRFPPDQYTMQNECKFFINITQPLRRLSVWHSLESADPRMWGNLAS